MALTATWRLVFVAQVRADVLEVLSLPPDAQVAATVCARARKPKNGSAYGAPTSQQRGTSTEQRGTLTEQRGTLAEQRGTLAEPAVETGSSGAAAAAKGDHEGSSDHGSSGKASKGGIAATAACSEGCRCVTPPQEACAPTAALTDVHATNAGMWWRRLGVALVLSVGVGGLVAMRRAVVWRRH